MMSTGSSMPNLFAHMGHSRTPSGCSAISFTSSVLSEPISENYPHAEPETDSKGFEIVRDVGSCLAQGHTAYHHGNGGTLTGSYHTSVEDIDDGNEADVEDLSDNPRRKKGGGGGGKRGGGEEKTVVVVGALRGVGGDNEPQQLDAKLVHKDEVETEGLAVVVETGGLAVAADRKETSEDEHSESECDSQRELPHIDSIHNSMYDLSTEILSQHSSRTIDNSEVLSTHSSRTLGESSVPLTNPDRLRHDGQRTPDGVRQTSPVRLMNSDRIQNWVEATQLCLQDMSGTSHVATPVTDDDDDDDEFVEAREMLKDTSDSDTDTENKLT
nr:hypothetical protein BaRGS_017366 [Batillaria attramentaria]